MRRLVTVGVAVLLAGCGATPPATRGEQVTLLRAADPNPACVGVYEVMDIEADANVGTITRQGGWPLKWPEGYTGWRFGSEVQVLDPNGELVLVTGQRYELALNSNVGFSEPMQDLEWTAGCMPTPCSRGRTCELGRHLL